ncbi:hypothetical protein ACFVXC_32410 [Streptomyces sp. NPDC058257]|uniref:hypothetical protein n=1 Tax=Streptomyces sp. NPDC058257 TaxID=3346409 RepID=UPI0036E1B918
MDWYPAPGKDLLLRTAAKFATGMAPDVAGSRWFRDPERKDVPAELRGWSPGPSYELNSTGDTAARRAGRALLIGTRWGTLDKAKVPGEFPQKSIAKAQQMKFSEINTDVRITFTDGSWIRLFTGTPSGAERLDQMSAAAQQRIAE